MSGSKHFDKIAWTVTVLILVVTILFMNGGALGLEVMAHTMGYENRLFDNTKVHTIDIVMSDWDEFISNATSEEYYTADIVIDGETYKNIAIRGKGNTSLSRVASMGSERYSFKIEFDHYDSSLTYHGLDKLCLNNLIQDSTMMKDYLTYTMMNAFGVHSSLCSFAYIAVNGEDWGLYLAVEGVEESYLERNYGSLYGELYKPDSISMGGGRGNGKDFNMDDFMNDADMPATSEDSGQNSRFQQIPGNGNFGFSQNRNGTGRNNLQEPDMTQDNTDSTADDQIAPNEKANRFSAEWNQDAMQGLTQGNKTAADRTINFGGKGDFGGKGSSDVKLQYVDDNISSYQNIWNNAKTDITDAEQMRLIESLEKLSSGEQIESVVDIEQVIRYFVVHNYVCNGDSYTGSMIHNYYLYEENGQMAMIPWDYNLAFGTFQGGNAQSTINTPIDAPVSGGTGEDRPMWNWILSDESYTEMYHQYFAEFLNTVDVQAIIDNAYNLIKSYVEKDPTAFYTYEEFETGVETMRQFCRLRSESISMQLANGETTTNMNYVDASGMTMSDMGSMSGKDGMGDKANFGGTRSSDRMVSTKADTTANAFPKLSIRETSASASAEIPQNGENAAGQERFDASQRQGISGGQRPNAGELPEGFDPSQMQGGFGSRFPGQSSTEAGTESSDNAGDTNSQVGNRPSRDNMQIPGGSWGSSINGMGNAASSSTNWIWLAVSVLILGAGLLIAKLYKRY